MVCLKLHQNRLNPLVLPVILAQELGYFAEAQLQVELRLADEFIFNGKEEFLAGEVDGMMGDTTFFFHYLEAGKQAKITANLTRTIQIVGQANLSQTDPLIVGVNRNGLFRFFQEKFLTGYLKTAKHQWINNTYDRIEALKTNQINSLVAIEPFISDILEEVPSKILWHSNQIEHYFVMWCFDRQLVEQEPAAIQQFHQAIGKAATWFNQLPAEQKKEACLTHGKYSEAHATRMSDFIFEEQGNYTKEDFELCQDWMYREKEINHKYASQDYLFQGIVDN